MKKFIIFTLCAIVALASCQKIDEPVITPEQSSFKVSAVIDDNSTKVTYEVTDDAVTPVWTVGDKILVYDGTGTAELTVNSVGPDGVATFADGYTPTEGATTLYAVYYPGKGTEDFADGQLKVDLTDQNGTMDGTTPAIMCATASVSGDEVRFRFYNQTAIIGVNKFQVKANETVSTFTAKGLVAKGTIKIEGDKLALAPADTKEDMTISFTTPISTGDNGRYETPLYFIAMPTSAAKIEINASGTEADYTTVSVVDAGNVEAGNYYYMSKKLINAVARYSNDGGTSWTNAASLKEAVESVTGTTAQHAKVELLKDAAHGSDAAIDLSGKYVDIDGCGYTYDVSSRPTDGKFVDNAVFTAFGGSTVSGEVSFKNITFDGKAADNTALKSRLIYNKSAMTFTFGEESYMKDITYQAHGENVNAGGVLYNEFGTYNFNGLTATNCCTKNSGSYYPCGGFIDNCGGTINLNSGLISGCQAFPSTIDKSRGGFAYVTNLSFASKY